MYSQKLRAKVFTVKVGRLLEEASDVVKNLQASLEIQKKVADVAQIMFIALRAGNKVLLCGNGGSAADCQHIAGELVGRFKLDRPGMAAIALTTDTSILTSVANDYGYKDVFRRQIESLGRKGDVLLAYSTSGMAESVVCAVIEAKRLGLHTVGITGADGGYLAREAETVVYVPSDLTPRIQECHAIIGHVLCDLVEEAFSQISQEV